MGEAKWKKTSCSLDNEEDGPGTRLALSFIIWLFCYYVMAVLGGTVAFYRFPREPTSDPEQYTLRDIGFQLLPEYCPKYWMHLNFQSLVLVFYYTYALAWSFLHRKERDGVVMLTRLMLISSLVFVTRTSVVGLTALPQPNFAHHCSTAQTNSVSFREALVEVCGSFPPKACGDLIFSGHVACAFVSLFIFDSLGAYPRPQQFCRFIFYALGALAVLSCLLCRSHYTVDVVLGLYFSSFLTTYYLQRANGLVHGGFAGNLIRYLEGQSPNHVYRCHKDMPRYGALCDDTALADGDSFLECVPPSSYHTSDTNVSINSCSSSNDYYQSRHCLEQNGYL